MNKLDDRLGLEPRFRGSKPLVLPLDDRSINLVVMGGNAPPYEAYETSVLLLNYITEIGAPTWTRTKTAR